jgi:D-3-phosphoglycerate dehydrogenase
MNNLNLIIDFDSTIIQKEGLDELTRIVAERKNTPSLFEKIEKITNQGMAGEIGFSESLSRRIELLDFTDEDLKKLINCLKLEITHSFKTEIDKLKEITDELVIVSGGFKDFIVPVVSELGISSEKIFANEFRFSETGDFIGIDTDNPLSQDNGKVKVVKELNLSGNTVVIGDGYTDYQIKESGAADYFVAFTANKAREEVISVADKEIKDFVELSKMIVLNSESNALSLNLQ